MKKTLLFIGGAILGYTLNTETGKKLRMWTSSKVQEQINHLVGKITEVTDSDSPSSAKTEESK